MGRKTGRYSTTDSGGETVRAFVPFPLPPRRPPLRVQGDLASLHHEALSSLRRLEIAGTMVPSAQGFVYGFVRKEAVLSSQIEGTQASMSDVLSWEATRKSDHPGDVEEVCNYVEALSWARTEIARPRGLPLCTRLLCEAHRRLMGGSRGRDRQPGVVRTSQNWIGGTRPGNARFVPPPPEEVVPALGSLERWLHGSDPLPPLVRAGLAHVQFETIHPFLDGNGRIGRLLIALLIEHWKLLGSPLLYLSVAFKRHRRAYHERLSAVRSDGDWEGWTEFFLECVRESAEDAVGSARRIHAVIGRDRRMVVNHRRATVSAVRLLDLLPEHPMVTLPRSIRLLKTSKPTAAKAIDALVRAGVLRETTGRKRDRVYAYEGYLKILEEDTALPG